MVRKRPRVDAEVFTEDWMSGMPLMWIAEKHGISRDTATAIRDELGLPKRHDRKKRYKPPRNVDPTPSVIRQRCKKIRDNWNEATEAERRVQKRVEWTVPEYPASLEDFRDIEDDPQEPA